MIEIFQSNELTMKPIMPIRKKFSRFSKGMALALLKSSYLAYIRKYYKIVRASWIWVGKLTIIKGINDIE